MRVLAGCAGEELHVRTISDNQLYGVCAYAMYVSQLRRYTAVSHRHLARLIAAADCCSCTERLLVSLTRLLFQLVVCRVD